MQRGVCKLTGWDVCKLTGGGGDEDAEACAK